MDRNNITASVVGLTDTWFSGTPSSYYNMLGNDLIVNNRPNEIGEEQLYMLHRDLIMLKDLIRIVWMGLLSL